MSDNQIVVYHPNETIRLDVRLEDETVWLNRQQLAELFGRDVKTIGKHITNALSEELNGMRVVAKFATTAADGKTYQMEHYSLDMILSVGYRVKSAQGIYFRKWANTVLKEYMLRGYSINTHLLQMEERIEHRLLQHDRDIAELKENVDFFVQTQMPPLMGVFYEGQIWDAAVLVVNLIASARKSILLIDNWATVQTLDLLAKKRSSVKVTVVTSEHRNRKTGAPDHKIKASDIDKFNAQYPQLVVKFSEHFHDRFLILDDREVYLIGASLKDLGKKCFGFVRMDAAEIPNIKARI